MLFIGDHYMLIVLRNVSNGLEKVIDIVKHLAKIVRFNLNDNYMLNECFYDLFGNNIFVQMLSF